MSLSTQTCAAQPAERMLAQRLISLAADTDHAGLRADATVLLAFARSVLDRSDLPDWGIDHGAEIN